MWDPLIVLVDNSYMGEVLLFLDFRKSYLGSILESLELSNFALSIFLWLTAVYRGLHNWYCRQWIIESPRGRSL